MVEVKRILMGTTLLGPQMDFAIVFSVFIFCSGVRPATV